MAHKLRINEEVLRFTKDFLGNFMPLSITVKPVNIKNSQAYEYLCTGCGGTCEGSCSGPCTGDCGSNCMGGFFGTQSK